MEAVHLDQHPQVAPGRSSRDGRAAKPARPRAPGVLEAALLAAHAERHVAGLGRHAELPEQPQQVRVGALVVHDEAGVQADPAARPWPRPPCWRGRRSGGRARTASRRGASRDVGRGQAGHAAADHRDPHRRPPRSWPAPRRAPADRDGRHLPAGGAASAAGGRKRRRPRRRTRPSPPARPAATPPAGASTMAMPETTSRMPTVTDSSATAERRSDVDASSPWRAITSGFRIADTP